MKSEIDKTVSNYKQYLTHVGYKKGTVNMLPSCLKELLLKTPKSIDNITSEDILKHVEYLHNRPNKRRDGGLSESYINHHIYSLKLFFEWQLRIGNLTQNVMSGLEFKTPEQKQRIVLTQEEIKKLYKACETYQEKAVLHLCYGCGLRRTEAESLNLKDLHFRAELLYVREGKNSKRRVVPLPKNIGKELKEYVFKERFTNRNETSFLLNKRGFRMRGSSYNLILKNLLEKAQITKQASLHNLRHSIATHLLEQGLSVEYVRDFLGHKYLESTQVYIRVKNSEIWSWNSI
jgi:integrase/recombinase XerD